MGHAARGLGIQEDSVGLGRNMWHAATWKGVQLYAWAAPIGKRISEWSWHGKGGRGFNYPPPDSPCHCSNQMPSDFCNARVQGGRRCPCRGDPPRRVGRAGGLAASHELAQGVLHLPVVWQHVEGSRMGPLRLQLHRQQPRCVHPCRQCPVACAPCACHEKGRGRNV